MVEKPNDNPGEFTWTIVGAFYLENSVGIGLTFYKNNY